MKKCNLCLTSKIELSFIWKKQAMFMLGNAQMQAIFQLGHRATIQLRITQMQAIFESKN